MGQDAPDPIAGLEGKLSEFAQGLSDEERAVFAEMVHRAAAVEPEVGGLSMSNPYIDPCDGGEVFDPGVFDMLRRLKVSIKWQPETVRHSKGSGKG